MCADVDSAVCVQKRFNGFVEMIEPKCIRPKDEFEKSEEMMKPKCIPIKFLISLR